MEIFPGSRVMVWDHRLWKRDDLTPDCYRIGTVVCRYGLKELAKPNWPERIYDDLVDVEFDYRPGEISTGHFTYGIKHV